MDEHPQDGSNSALTDSDFPWLREVFSEQAMVGANDDTKTKAAKEKRSLMAYSCPASR